MDNGQCGTLGHPVQPRVAEGHSSERDTATIHRHKMAALCASENRQRVNRAAHGIAQVLSKSGIIKFRFVWVSADRGTPSTPS